MSYQPINGVTSSCDQTDPDQSTFSRSFIIEPSDNKMSNEEKKKAISSNEYQTQWWIVQGVSHPAVQVRGGSRGLGTGVDWDKNGQDSTPFKDW